MILEISGNYEIILFFYWFFVVENLHLLKPSHFSNVYSNLTFENLKSSWLEIKIIIPSFEEIELE